MERLTISGTKEAKPDVTIREVLNKLAEYEDLEEQGKLLELPCAVGDRSFVVWQKKGQNPIRKMELKKIEIHESKRKVYQMEFTGNKGCWFKFHDDDFGKTHQRRSRIRVESRETRRRCMSAGFSSLRGIAGSHKRTAQAGP